jgi:hypothetical protein
MWALATGGCLSELFSCGLHVATVLVELVTHTDTSRLTHTETPHQSINRSTDQQWESARVRARTVWHFYVFGFKSTCPSSRLEVSQPIGQSAE